MAMGTTAWWSAMTSLAGCWWLHARRKFVDAEKARPQLAAEAVGIIKRLYAIEERGKPLTVEQRTALRQMESVPILAALKDKLHDRRGPPAAQTSDEPGDRLQPQPVDRAQRLLHPTARCPSTTTPASGRSSVVLNRKNSLFVGNERGGRATSPRSSALSPAPVNATTSTRNRASRNC